MNQFKNLTKGIIKENPILVLVLGTCPTLATTSSSLNGMGMGLATAFVLIGSNSAISLLANVIPDKVRIPAYVVIIASFVTIVDLMMQAYVPSLYGKLGIFIPLIVVNCIVLGRAEAFANKNTVLSSALDGLGMGLGFTLALGVLGAFREIVGSGSLFGHKFLPGDGVLVFVLAPGAFMALGYLIAIVNQIKKKL
jgi:electron transport complex protein RnfE